MSTIYLVIGREEYEGSDVMRAFHSENNAEAFAVKCRNHESARPRFPADPSTDAEWLSYERKERRWKNAHPAGKDFSAWPYYDVQSVEMGDTE